MIVFGYILGKLGDRYGYKKILLFSCLTLIVITSVFFLSSSANALYLVAVIGGAGAGGYYTVSRALMMKISPPDKLGEYFGFYSAFSRFASITAPLIWGGITLALKNTNSVKYQVAGMVMVGLLVVGTIILLNVSESKRS
jgi:UMF1 family MFS transporter